MKKILGFFIIAIFCCNIAYSKIFISHRADSCGPKKKDFKDTKQSENGAYFFINYDLDHDFIIYNEGYQFASFEEKIYHQLNNQRGVTTSADIKRNGDAFIFILNKEFHKPKLKVTTSLEINFNSDTFKATTVSNNKTETLEGICW